jgi:hypothetical protein
MNKSIICAIVLAAAPAVSFSKDICGAMGGLSETIMKARQQGIALSTINPLVAGMDPELRPIAEAIVRTAYRMPRYDSDRMRSNAPAEFRNMVEMDCYDKTK